ncbi:MAG: hypothetical protein EOO39_04355 [Cytophagaceae bacterium]|nr:MAG: hypothetical protein EOO39_04355 [Cytophagaceae bacterium]
MARTFLIVCCIVLMVGSCHQKDISPVTDVAGMLNGNNWQQTGWLFKGRVWKTEGINSYPCKLNTININIEQYNSDGFRRQNLFIAKIPPRVGVYRIRDIYSCDENADVGARFFLIGQDGDVITAIFNVAESGSNTLSVDQIDSTARQLSGRLRLTLWAAERGSTTPYDTIRITDCRFVLPFESN